MFIKLPEAKNAEELHLTKTTMPNAATCQQNMRRPPNTTE